jgi:hypothetical protein
MQRARIFASFATLTGTGLAAALVAGGLSALAATPAHAADASVTITQTPMVRYSTDCIEHPVTFRAQGSGPDAGDWSLKLLLWENGASTPAAQTTYAYQGAADAAQATVKLRVCGSDFTPGTYSLEYRLSHGPDRSRLLADSTTFTVRAPRSRTRLATSSLGGGKHRATLRARVETPNGFKARKGVKVRLQYQTSSGWALVKGTRAHTAANGNVTLTFTSPNPRKPVTVRATTAPAPFRAGSSSPTRTIGG